MTEYFTSALLKQQLDCCIALVENVQVPRNADSEPVTLRLAAVQGGTLVSVVLNLTNGEPVPEAWCRLTTSSGVRFDHGQKRDDEGVMRINNLPSGKDTSKKIISIVASLAYMSFIFRGARELGFRKKIRKRPFTGAFTNFLYVQCAKRITKLII